MIATLQAIAVAMQQIITLEPQVEAALTALSTFLATV
jgi:hypothetical protein